MDLTGPEGAGVAAVALLDVQPILKRDREGIWARAENERDVLCSTIERLCRENGFRPLVIKSGPFVQPVWVKLECWVPRTEGQPPVTERRSAVITIQAREYHRFEFEYTVELDDRGHKKTYQRLRSFDTRQATQLVRFFLLDGPRPRFSKFQLRQKHVHVWRPRNKVTILRTDWLRISAVPAMVLGFLLIPVPFIGFLLLIAGVVAFFVARKRRLVVRSSGKPEAEPRALYRVDSWQAVISGLGKDADEVRNRFQAVIADPPMSGFHSRVEKIWYWGLDGTVERLQLVLTLRRAIVFCQIHPYDDELYVGWDGHLNRGQWVEKTLAKGLDRQTGVPTHVNSVVPGEQPLTEYDLTDLNCLMEWTHAKLVKIVKDLMEERRIDQEIDFTILRGERQGATKPRRSDGTGDSDRHLARNPVSQLGRSLLRTG